MQIKTMKRIILITLALGILFVSPIYAQNNWDEYKDTKLILVKYGVFKNGKEANVFYPSNNNKNDGEFIMLRSDGTFVWGNSGFSKTNWFFNFM